MHYIYQSKTKCLNCLKNKLENKTPTNKIQPYATYKKLTSPVTQTENKRLEKAVSFKRKFQTKMSNYINISQSKL